MNPLIIVGGLGKTVDTLLVNEESVRHTQIGAFQGLTVGNTFYGYAHGAGS